MKINSTRSNKQGTNIKLKRAILMVALLFVFTGMGAVWASYLSLNDDSMYDIGSITVTQHGEKMFVQWDDVGAYKYKVVVKRKGGERIVVYSNTGQCELAVDKVSEHYTVKVMAVDDNGRPSGLKQTVLFMHKIPQEIKTTQEAYNGLGEKTQDMKAVAIGWMTFASSDSKVVSVTQDGDMKFHKEGRAKIVITSSGNGKYARARKVVPVMVYPDILDTPQMKIKKKSHDDVTLTWGKIKYAQNYDIYKMNPLSKKYQKVYAVGMADREITIPRDPSLYKLQVTATINDDVVKSGMSKPIEIKSVADEAKSYNSYHKLKTLDESNLTLVAEISGSGGASVPQSMSKVGSNYVVTFVNQSGTKGVLKTYTSLGEQIGTQSISGMGHANGSTYNPNTDKIYTVKTHKAIWSPSCTTYEVGKGYKKDTFNLPKNTSGIAYDESTNKYCLAKGSELYVTDSTFNIEKTMRKFIRHHHAQDIGIHNGVVMVCTWISDDESYIDLYRTKDGKYIGGYSVPFGEIESCFMDNGYLVILMNNARTWGDCIVRTTEKPPIP